MAVFGPRTPKFCILVTNYSTKHMFLEFWKNLYKHQFSNFGSIFGDFPETLAAGPQVTRFCSNLRHFFFHVVSRYAKNSKIGPKRFWAGPSPLNKGKYVYPSATQITRLSLFCFLKFMCNSIQFIY